MNHPISTIKSISANSKCSNRFVDYQAFSVYGTFPHSIDPYELKLASYMVENFPDHMYDIDFIHSRSVMADETYIKSIQADKSHEEALEEAYKVLYAGIKYSPFQLVKRVIRDKFWTLDEHDFIGFSIQMYTLCSSVILYYDVQDEQFPGSKEEEHLYSAISDTISQYLKINRLE